MQGGQDALHPGVRLLTQNTGCLSFLSEHVPQHLPPTTFQAQACGSGAGRAFASGLAVGAAGRPGPKVGTQNARRGQSGSFARRSGVDPFACTAPAAFVSAKACTPPTFCGPVGHTCRLASPSATCFCARHGSAHQFAPQPRHRDHGRQQHASCQPSQPCEQRGICTRALHHKSERPQPHSGHRERCPV